MAFVLVSIGSFHDFYTPFFSGTIFIGLIFKAWVLFQFIQFFAITEISQKCKFTMSDFEFFYFSFFFSNIQTVTVYGIST